MTLSPDTPWLAGAAPGTVSVAIAAILLLYFVTAEPPIGRRAFARLQSRRASDPGALLAFHRLTLAFQVAWIALVVLAVGLDPSISADRIGWRPPSGRGSDEALSLVYGATAAILVSGVVLARLVARGKPVPGLVTELLPRTGRERLSGLLVAVGAGLSEELVFRGLLLTVLTGLFPGVPPLLAGGALAVVFGLAHLYQGWPGVLATAAIGGLLTALYLGCGSLWPVVLLHAAIDVRAFVLMSAPPARTDAAVQG